MARVAGCSYSTAPGMDYGKKAKQKNSLTPVPTPVLTLFYAFVHVNDESRQEQKETGKQVLFGVFRWCTEKRFTFMIPLL